MPSVSVAIGEVIADVRKGLLAMAVGAGLQVMAVMMAEDVTAACGAEGPPRPGPGRDSARQ
jgi:putative transposase